MFVYSFRWTVFNQNLRYVFENRFIKDIQPNTEYWMSKTVPPNETHIMFWQMKPKN